MRGSAHSVRYAARAACVASLIPARVWLGYVIIRQGGSYGTCDAVGARQDKAVDYHPQSTPAAADASAQASSSSPRSTQGCAWAISYERSSGRVVPSEQGEACRTLSEVALSVGSVTLCEGGLQRASAVHVWKESA